MTEKCPVTCGFCNDGASATTTASAAETTPPAPVTTAPNPVTTPPAPVTTPPAPVTTAPDPITTAAEGETFESILFIPALSCLKYRVFFSHYNGLKLKWCRMCGL